MNSWKRVRALTKTFTANAEMRLPKEGPRGRLYMALAVLAVSCIMIPCCLIVGYISYMMTESFLVMGVPAGNGLLAEIHIMSAFSMVFGILVIFNLFFFSSDREHLVPLPLKPEEILAGKFIFAYFAESVMEFLVLLAMFVGFIIAYGPKPMAMIGGLIGTFVIPLLPLTYCGILSLLIMALLKKVRSNRFFGSISTILLLGFVGLFMLSFKGMGPITVESYVDSLAAGTNLFSNVLNKVFFTTPVLLKSIEESNILFLLLYLVLHLVVVAVMLFLGHLLYQEGLFTVARLGSKSGKKEALQKDQKQTPVFLSYVKKEWKVLIRTKAYRVNCVMINLLWPIALGVIFLRNKEESYLTHLINILHSGETFPVVLLTVCVIGVAFIASSMNSVASTAFTREGAHLSLVKYIPVSYKKQLQAKGIIAILVSGLPLLLTLILAAVYMELPAWLVLYYAVMILLIVFCTTSLGLVLDSTKPHSDWDDEYSALRGNLNTFFHMAVTMLVAAFLGGVFFLVYYYSNLNGMFLHMGVMVVLVLMAILMGVFGYQKTLQNLEEL